MRASSISTKQRNGRSPYNHIFDCSMTISGQQCSVSVTSVSGHVMNYDFPPPYNKWCVLGRRKLCC